MGENKPLLTIHSFQFKMFDPLPRPDEDTAYILYQEGASLDKVLVITSGSKVSAADIMRGRYNKKAEVSLKWRDFTFQKEIADQTHRYIFTIMVKLRYRITDCAYVFRSKLYHIEQLLRNLVLNRINSCHGRSDITYRIELENYLMNIIAKGLQEMPFLIIEELSVKADLDEGGKAVLQARLDAATNDTIEEAESEREKKKIQREKEVEEKRLQTQWELQKKKDEQDLAKAKRDMELKNELGTDYSAFKALNNGDISYLEYGELSRRNWKASMMDKIEVVKEVADMDVLPDEILQKISLELIGMKTEEDHRQLSDVRQKAGLPDGTDKANDVINAEGYL